MKITGSLLPTLNHAPGDSLQTDQPRGRSNALFAVAGPAAFGRAWEERGYSSRQAEARTRQIGRQVRQSHE